MRRRDANKCWLQSPIVPVYQSLCDATATPQMYHFYSNSNNVHSCSSRVLRSLARRVILAGTPSRFMKPRFLEKKYRPNTCLGSWHEYLSGNYFLQDHAGRRRITIMPHVSILKALYTILGQGSRSRRIAASDLTYYYCDCLHPAASLMYKQASADVR